MTREPEYTFRILDRATGGPLVAANVVQLDADGNYTLIGSSTNLDGEATLPAGTYEARYVGYVPLRFIAPGPVTVYLEPATIMLDEFEVTYQPPAKKFNPWPFVLIAGAALYSRL